MYNLTRSSIEGKRSDLLLGIALMEMFQVLVGFSVGLDVALEVLSSNHNKASFVDFLS
jgi:hypothetical protein